MTTPKRRFLGRYNTPITRHAVYATGAAIEVDQQENFKIIRKRVFFEDVLLVTQHDRVGILAVMFSLGFAAFLMLIGGIAGGNSGLAFGTAALVFLVYGFARIKVKESIITVFGRRSKARIRFTMRRARARRLYEEICEMVRAAQEVPSDLDQDSSVREG
jgi:hypothetical protein